ncbi:hypothetical protein JCM8547_004032 [Rhodosporidiobolus lusitaniae]
MQGLSFLASSIALLASSAVAAPLQGLDTPVILQQQRDMIYRGCVEGPIPLAMNLGTAQNARYCLNLCDWFGMDDCFVYKLSCYGSCGVELDLTPAPDSDCQQLCLDKDSSLACGTSTTRALHYVYSPPPVESTLPGDTATATATLPSTTTSTSSNTTTTTDAPTATSTTTDDSATSVGSFTVSTVAAQPTATSTKLLTDENWNYKCCYTDSREIRSLKKILNHGGRWDVEHCLDAARAEGFLYAGLITGGECWRQDASKCMRPCNDDNNYTCGGLKGLDVYSTTHSKKLLDNPDWQFAYNGCFSDSIEPNRSLPFLIQRGDGWTIGTCLTAAEIKGYSFAALEVGGECWVRRLPAICDGSPLTADRCNHKCNDEERHCGGDWAIDVYSFIPATQDDE